VMLSSPIWTTSQNKPAKRLMKKGPFAGLFFVPGYYNPRA